MSEEVIAPSAAAGRLYTTPGGYVAGIDKAAAPARAWKGYKKLLFRIFFIFFIGMCIPLNAEWYKNLFGINWLKLNYRDIYDIARFSPSFFRGGSDAWYYLMGYGDWLLLLAIATAGGLIWTAVDRKTQQYNQLYYWLRVVVRYRAGIGIIGFGFTKLFPVQMPYPSLGLLNTNFGDFTAQKIYWLSIGIVPWYQVFAGVVELAAGTLLFFRRTTTLGAVLLLGALGDITFVNFSYDGGVHVYASYFVVFALFLLVYDAPYIYRLLIQERFTVPVYHYPSFSKKWQQWIRAGLKTATFGIFLVLLFYLQYVNFRYDPYKQPSTKGVTQLRGNYRVAEFKINNVSIPYSPLDSLRWRDVTFENWTSLTYKVNKPVALDLSNGGGAPQRDIDRTFEVTGTAGGTRVFHYYADTINKVLYLQDKNIAGIARRNNAAKQGKRTKDAAVSDNWISKAAWANIGDEKNMIDSRAASTRRDREFAQPQTIKRNRMILHYDTQDGSRVVLNGINEKKDSVYIVLERIDKQYVLTGSSLQAGKY